MLTAMGGQEVAGGAVPVGKGGIVLLEEPPVLSAMEEPPVVEDGRRESP